MTRKITIAKLCLLDKLVYGHLLSVYLNNTSEIILVAQFPQYTFHSYSNSMYHYFSYEDSTMTILRLHYQHLVDKFIEQLLCMLRAMLDACELAARRIAESTPLESLLSSREDNL